MSAMFTLRRVGARFELALDNEPGNAFSLEMAPSHLEPMLRDGVWVVVAFAVWSVPDIDSINVALSIAHDNPDLRVGIRPFDAHTELDTWCKVPERALSPIWVLLSEGKQLGFIVGNMHREEVQRTIDGILPHD